MVRPSLNLQSVDAATTTRQATRHRNYLTLRLKSVLVQPVSATAL